MKSRWETPAACSSTIGIAPNRLKIGYAWRDDDGDWSGPAVVVWEETEHGWRRGPLIPAALSHFVVSVANQALVLAGPESAQSYYNDESYFTEERELLAVPA